MTRKESIKIIKPLSTNNIGLIKNNEGRGLALFKGCRQTISAPYNSKTGQLETGLEIMVANPFYTSKKETPDEKEQILLRTLLERQLKEKNLDPYSPYWESFRVALTNDDMQLDTDIPLQNLTYHFCIANPKVIKSIKDLSKKPEAKWFVEDKELEAEEAIKEAEYIDQALTLYKDADITLKRIYARILGNSEVADENTSEKLVNAYLLNFLKNNPKDFLNKLKMTPEELVAQSEILEAIEKGIIRKQDGVFTRITSDGSPGAVIGETIHIAIKFLLAPKNEPLRAGIIREVKERKNK